MVRSAMARLAPQEGRLDASGGSSFVAHASHGLLPLVRGGDSDGRCLIEPAVLCAHCGYCQSLGH